MALAAAAVSGCASGPFSAHLESSATQVRECAHDLARPQARGELLAAARVPDDYSTGHRVIGLYWLTRIPFAAGVKRWESGTLARFHSEAQINPNRVRYAPPAGPVLARSTIAGLLARAQLDPLGQPQLNERELGLLAAAYAPSDLIERRFELDLAERVR